MNIDQRLSRISNTSHLVFLDDLSIHKIDSFEILDDNIFIETNTGFLFQDLDVFTLEEAHAIELKVKQLLDECA
jgi:hypothetical protein